VDHDLGEVFLAEQEVFADPQQVFLPLMRQWSSPPDAGVTNRKSPQAEQGTRLHRNCRCDVGSAAANPCASWTRSPRCGLSDGLRSYGLSVSSPPNSVRRAICQDPGRAFYSIEVLNGTERESIRPSVVRAARVARGARRGRANAPAKKPAWRAINAKAMAPEGRQRSAPWASAAAAVEIKRSTMAGTRASALKRSPSTAPNRKLRAVSGIIGLRSNCRDVKFGLRQSAAKSGDSLRHTINPRRLSSDLPPEIRDAAIFGESREPASDLRAQQRCGPATNAVDLDRQRICTGCVQCCGASRGRRSAVKGGITSASTAFFVRVNRI
jgi:hypothetical protein